MVKPVPTPPKEVPYMERVEHYEAEATRVVDTDGRATKIARDTARYEAVAREHGADLSEEGFDAALKKVAGHKPIAEEAAIGSATDRVGISNESLRGGRGAAERSRERTRESKERIKKDKPGL